MLDPVAITTGGVLELNCKSLQALLECSVSGVVVHCIIARPFRNTADVEF